MWVPRAPQGPTQVAPAGLMSFLSLKGGGQQPDGLAQTTQPVLDIEGFWKRSARVKVLTAYTGAAVAGVYQAVLPLADAGGARLTPGPSAWWWIDNITISLNAAVAGSTGLAVAYRENGGPGGSSSIALTQGRYVTGQDQACFGDFWLPPTGELGIYISETLAGGTLALNLVNCSYVPFPI